MIALPGGPAPDMDPRRDPGILLAPNRERISLRRICVFCGAHPGHDPAFAAAAQALARCMVERGLGVVTGGGSVGLMGAVADAALAAGGTVIGVIPQGLARKEIAHQGLTEQHVVPDMHTRKALMAELSDAFIALPGGFGTLEELFEVTTWGQLGIHHKPIGVLNVLGYYDPLLAQIDHGVAQGFIRVEYRTLLRASHDPASLIDLLLDEPAPRFRIWMTEEET